MGRVDVSFLTCLSKGEIPNTAGGGLERTRMGANLWGYDDHPDSPLGGVLRYIHVVMISIVSHPFYNIFGWSTNVFVQLCLRPGMGQPSNVLGQPGNDYVDKVKDEGKYFFVFFSLFSGLPGPLGVLSITRPVLSRSDRVLDFHAA